MALVSKPFADIITFTRASTATYFDATGTLQSAAIDAPRFDYNPATLAARGFLIEEARTNLLTYSAAINTTPNWVTNASTVTANAVISPDGTTSTDKLIADIATAEHTVEQAFIATAGATYTFSAFVKKADYDFFSLRFTVAAVWGGTSPQVILNLNTLALTNNAGVLSSSVTDAGNGYYRLVMSATCAVSGTPGARLQILGNTSANSFTGDGVSGTYVWGAQLEVGAFPTSYIPTTTTALTRSADVASVNTLSPWYRADEGTLYAEFTPTGAYVNARGAVGLNDGTTSNFMYIGTRDGSANYGANNRVAAGAITAIGSFGAANTSTQKAAFAYANLDQAVTFNGASVATASLSVPTVSVLALGRGGTTTTSSAYLRRVTYYPRRLSNAELQSITA